MIELLALWHEERVSIWKKGRTDVYPYSVGCKKKAHPKDELLKKIGSDLLSHRKAVPSALKGLTTLFGMVRGGAPSL